MQVLISCSRGDVLATFVSNQVNVMNVSIYPLGTTQTAISQNEYSELLHRVSSLIRQEATNPEFDVVQLAHRIGMPKVELNRRVKTLTGESISTMLLKHRLQLAAQLLKQPGLNMKEIALQSGFYYQTMLSKSFQQEFGCSPKAYQERVVESTKLTDASGWRSCYLKQDWNCLMEKMRANKWLSAFFKEVLMNLSKGRFSETELSMALCITPAALKKLTRDYFAVSPQRLILCARLFYAMECRGKQPAFTDEVALKAGFTNARHLQHIYSLTFKLATLGAK